MVGDEDVRWQATIGTGVEGLGIMGDWKWFRTWYLVPNSEHALLVSGGRFLFGLHISLCESCWKISKKLWTGGSTVWVRIFPPQNVMNEKHLEGG